MVYNALAIVQVGDAPDVLHPSIDDNLNVIPEENDGAFGVPFQISMASIRRKVGNNWVSQLRTKDLSLQVWITGSRVVIYCRNYDKGGGWVGFGLGGLAVALTANAISKGMAANRRKGKALVGNIRYPWITKVGFAPRNGIGTRETIDIHYVDGTDPTKPECSLTLHFDNRSNANQIARYITDRIIAYRYASTAEISDETLAKLETLRTSGLREAPAKGFVHYYTLPTSWKVPHGLDTRPVGVPAYPPTPRAASGLAAAPAVEVPPALEVAPAVATCASCGSVELGTAFCTDCGQPVAV